MAGSPPPAGSGASMPAHQRWIVLGMTLALLALPHVLYPVFLMKVLC
ncbi:MAG: branched-chain amino acid ABC transporter permease, partial [Azospirillum sp.]|nr:branched-chain amino acid ABC transporter permease [Azospirillum sp.]